MMRVCLWHACSPFASLLGCVHDDGLHDVFASLLTGCCAAAGCDNYTYIMIGAWTEKKNDGSKGGQKLTASKIGPFLVSATSLNSPHTRLSPTLTLCARSCDDAAQCVAHSCGGCNTGYALAYPIGGDSFCTEPFGWYCGPMCLCPKADGTISDGCGTTYAKDDSFATPQGAPPSAEMER